MKVFHKIPVFFEGWLPLAAKLRMFSVGDTWYRVYFACFESDILVLVDIQPTSRFVCVHLKGVLLRQKQRNADNNSSCILFCPLTGIKHCQRHNGPRVLSL